MLFFLGYIYKQNFPIPLLLPSTLSHLHAVNPLLSPLHYMNNATHEQRHFTIYNKLSNQKEKWKTI